MAIKNSTRLANIYKQITKNDALYNENQIEDSKATVFYLKEGLCKVTINKFQCQLPLKSKLIFDNRLLVILHKKGSSIDFIRTELINKGFIEKE